MYRPEASQSSSTMKTMAQGPIPLLRTEPLQPSFQLFYGLLH